jgi:hypothetical protein
MQDRERPPLLDTESVMRLAGSLQATLIETPLSWVLLAGESAYKLKKPVLMPFVDYRALAQRHHFCEEELRLNRRLAPTLYLDVCRITGTPQAPALNGRGKVLDHAVHMRRFPAGALFSEQLRAGALRAGAVDELAALLARFHEAAPRAAPDSGYATPALREQLALAALAGVRAVAQERSPGTPTEIAALREWLVAQARVLAQIWQDRLLQGHVRECHGDLHLANVVSLADGVAAFDGIEFDPALRWIDVMDDLAFAVMDFDAMGRSDLAFRLLNGWLDRTGDHAGLAVLRFSVVYRALVRTQVALQRGGAGSAAARDYLRTALAWAVPGTPALCIMHGLPGSGKTFESQRLLERQSAVRLRSDVERKRLAGLGPLDASAARVPDLYDSRWTARTYTHLLAMARIALQAGFAVILDAAFLKRSEREQAHALAQSLGVAFSIFACTADPQVLRERLLARHGDASEADLAVLEKLQAVAQPLAGDELQYLCPPVRQIG